MRQAIDINPNFSFAYVWLGTLLAYAGKLDEANEAFDQAYRISPKDPFNAMLTGLRGIGYFTAARDAEALEFVNESLRARPDWVGAWRMYTVCAAAHGDVA